MATSPQHSSTSSTDISFLDFRLSIAEQRLFHGEKTLKLEPQAFSILRFLVENAHRVVTKTELLDTFWANKIVTDASISNEIRQIRNALGDSGKQQTFIRTVHGKGFQFVAELALTNSRSSINADQTPTLIGRQNEIAHLCALLIEPTTQLLTIHGPGGMGKTTLALAMKSKLKDMFLDGIWFVDLVRAKDSRDVFEEIIHALSLEKSISTHQDSVEVVAQKIGALLSSQRSLLILDNFEHVLDAAESLSGLIQEAGNLKILVTSRELLCIGAETYYSLDGIHTYTDIDNPVLSPAGILFSERVRVSPRPDTKDKHTIGLINRIVQSLGGMPLAIEMAAAWLRYMPLAELAVEIEQSLGWLETDLKEVPERQRSARLIFESSWQRLSTSEQNGLAKLALFPMGFTLSWVRSFGNLNVRELADLERSGLIRNLGDGRYSIHEMIRQLSIEKLKASSGYLTSYNAMLIYLDLQLRLFIHYTNYTTDRSHLYEQALFLLDTVAYVADTYLQRHSWLSLQRYLILRLGVGPNSRAQERTLDRYLLPLKPHLDIETYHSWEIERLWMAVWQRRDNLDSVISHADVLAKDMAAIEPLHGAHIQAITSEICRVNESFEQSLLRAEAALPTFNSWFTSRNQHPDKPYIISLLSAYAITLNNTKQHQAALKVTELALDIVARSKRQGIWMGGYAAKAWTLGHLGRIEESHQQSLIQFKTSLDIGKKDFLSIWTLQAAQISEMAGHIEDACDFLAFSEFYRRYQNSLDLTDTLRTHEVDSFLERLKTTLGEYRFQQVLLRHEGRKIADVAELALATFARCTQNQS